MAGDGAERPILVVGCPRSGTTLLQVMLHAHSRIAIPPETKYLVDAYRARAGFGDLGTDRGRAALADFVVGRRTFGDLGLDPEDARRRILDAPPTLGSGLGAVHAGYAGRFGKPRWGDKRPGQFQDLRVLLRMFPRAQVVHLVRDGRDCVASLTRMPWFHEDPVAAMVLWIRSVDACRRASRRLPPDVYTVLRYEDLVADPERELRRLCAFLGERFEPAMAEPGRTAREAVPPRKTWHGRTGRAVDVAAVGHGASLEPWQRRLMDTVAAGRLREYGYEVDPGASASARELARYARTLAVKRAMVARRHAADRVLDARLRDDVAARP